MALTEINLPTKTNFYGDINQLASNMNRLMNQWREAAEFMAQMSDADLVSMGIMNPSQERTDIIQFRTAVNEMVEYYEGDKVDAPTNTPATVCNKIRTMRG